MKFTFTDFVMRSIITILMLRGIGLMPRSFQVGIDLPLVIVGGIAIFALACFAIIIYPEMRELERKIATIEKTTQKGA